MKLVLDTQVWLDWLVFSDPSTALLHSLVDLGCAQILIDPACAGELERVATTYPLGRKAPDPAARAACLRRAKEIARQASVEKQPGPLPPCADPDDQKFLELARDTGADFLVTRDRALLELAPGSGSGTELPFAVVTAPALASMFVKLRLGGETYPFGEFLFQEAAPRDVAKTVRRLAKRLAAEKPKRKTPLHVVIVVPSLDRVEPPQGDALWHAAAQGGAYFYVVDPPELVRLVDAADALARGSGKIAPMVALDFLLLERFNAALAAKEIGA